MLMLTWVGCVLAQMCICSMRTVAGECGDVSRAARRFNGARTRTVHVLVARSARSGGAYKPDVDDTRESPSFELIKILEDRGALVEYSDPHIAETPRVRKHDLKMTSIELTPANIKAFDCVLVATNHAAFDYGTVAANAKLIVDTRDAMRAFHDELGDRLVLA